MIDSGLTTRATDAPNVLTTGHGLLEQAYTIHAVHDCDSPPEIGHMQLDGNSLRLRHWPDRIWQIAPLGTEQTEGVDISHGKVVLCLSGDGALEFLSDYTSANLPAANVRQAGTIRTGLGHYKVLLWWSTTQKIHICVDRSYAQSLVDLLGQISLRRSSKMK